MKKIKKGTIVARKSYEKDIMFVVKRIIKTSNGDIAILRGLVERIEADSKLDDLEIVDKKHIEKRMKEENDRLRQRMGKKDKYTIGIIENKETRFRQKIVTGKILHLDGDRRYSQKSYNYYKKLGLDAVVKNIPEYKQPKVVYQLLKMYNPDILIITGHDRDDKKGS